MIEENATDNGIFDNDISDSGDTVQDQEDIVNEINSIRDTVDELVRANENDIEIVEVAEEEPEEETSSSAESTVDYESLLIQISGQLELNNQILAVQGVFIGIVCGLVAIKIFIDRLFK